MTAQRTITRQQEAMVELARPYADAIVKALTEAGKSEAEIELAVTKWVRDNGSDLLKSRTADADLGRGGVFIDAFSGSARGAILKALQNPLTPAQPQRAITKAMKDGLAAGAAREERLNPRTNRPNPATELSKRRNLERAEHMKEARGNTIHFTHGIHEGLKGPNV